MTEPLDPDVADEDIESLEAELNSLLTSKADSARGLELHSRIIDAAGVQKNEPALIRAVELASTLELMCDEGATCLVRYNVSNAWAALHRLRNQPSNVWSWDQPELIEEIYWLRSAIAHEGYAKLPRPHRAQLRCNLGNILSEVGRFVDALVEWRGALAEQPILGMAHGNLGAGLIRYGHALYDEGQAYWFVRAGRESLAAAVVGGIGRDGATFPEALEYFKRCLNDANRMLTSCGEDNDDPLPTYPLGDTPNERQYREWVLSKNLFLNPLNDLGPHSAASHDILMLPSHSASASGITFLAFFNQLKQEYAYARWCLYDGMHSENVHLADREVVLSLNGDGACYSIAIESIKTAIRCAYSLLDKVAYFINAFWQLEIPERRVNFRSIWFAESKDKRAKAMVRDVFETSENWPLRGLFWLAKDIYSDQLRGVSHPDAKELDALRNHLEHKYVKVKDTESEPITESDIFVDNLAHVINRDELESKAEHILRMSRTAIIYLSLAMHIEARKRSNDGAMPLSVDTYPDDLKH